MTYKQNAQNEKKLKKGVDKPKRMRYITPQQSHHRAHNTNNKPKNEENTK
jgi:hypothetical protein